MFFLNLRSIRTYRATYHWCKNKFHFHNARNCEDKQMKNDGTETDAISNDIDSDLERGISHTGKNESNYMSEYSTLDGTNDHYNGKVTNEVSFNGNGNKDDDNGQNRMIGANNVFKCIPSNPPDTPLSANDMNTYHPSFLYCGECTSCLAPPPINECLFTLSGDNTNTDNIKISTELEMTTIDNSIALLSNQTKNISQFIIHNMVDESQFLAICSLIRPVEGVNEIYHNVSKRKVSIDHDAFTAPASFILAKLKTEGGYEAELIYDAGSTIVNTANPSGICKSSILVKEGLCCNSEVPALKNILENIEGVKRVSGINITTRIIYVQHDPFIVHVNELANILTQEGFISIVKRDGARKFSRKPSDISNNLSVPGTISDSVSSPLTKIKSTFVTAQNEDLHPAKYAESLLRFGHLSTIDHVKSIERIFKAANSRNRIETGKKKMIQAFQPHIESKTLKVEHDSNFISASNLAILLSEDGSVGAVEVLEDGAEVGRFVHNTSIAKTNEISDVKLEDVMGGMKGNVVFSGIFWVLSMLSLINENWQNLKYCGLLSVFFGLPPIARKAYRTLKRREFDANCMMLIAAVGALGLQEYDEAASVAFLFAISELLEARATIRARVALNTIVNMRPDSANVVDETTNEVTIGVPCENVAVGSLVSVRAGDKIPCDGVVVDGNTLVNESSLTGEAKPIAKKVKDDVFGGTVNIGDSPLLVRTTSTVEDSAVSRLISLVEEAQSNQSPTEKLVDSFAKKYTPAVIFLAALMCTIPWAWGYETGKYWALNGLIIIVIACPCALTISTPVTYSAGLAATAQNGVIVKGGARLEALGKVKKVIFDKTGTLTNGKFELSELNCIGDKCTRKEMLELLLIIESPSSHPLSSTLLKAIKKEKIGIPDGTIVKDHTILKGEGVTARVNNSQIYVGNRLLFERIGHYQQMSEVDKFMVEQWCNSGGTVGFIGKEDIGIIGAFCVMDSVRKEAKNVVNQLKAYGIQVIMLTGDAKGAALHVGNKIGLDHSNIKYQLTPDAKLHCIGTLKGFQGSTGICGQPNLILMCGDGVNDAPALAISDVGVAMGDGAALALEMSDVTLMDSNLEKLLFCITIGKRVLLTIQQNIAISLLTKLIVVVFTFLGWMSLFSAIAADVGIMLVVTLNGMKLLPRREVKNKIEKNNVKMPPLVQGKELPDIV